VVFKGEFPWKEKSGDNFRSQMMHRDEHFYNPENITLVLTGFCYLGKENQVIYINCN